MIQLWKHAKPIVLLIILFQVSLEIAKANCFIFLSTMKAFIYFSRTLCSRQKNKRAEARCYFFVIQVFNQIRYFTTEDTNRKIRKTELIYICGILIGSKLGYSTVNTGKRMRVSTKALLRCVSTWLAIWYLNHTTVCYSVLSISIFIHYRTARISNNKG